MSQAEPHPVTDADVLAAWQDYYRRPAEWGHIEPMPEPDPRDHYTEIILQALRQVLEADRKRVSERGTV